MIRAVIHGAHWPPEGSRPNAHYRGTGTSPRLPGGAAAAAAAATRLLTSRHEPCARPAGAAQRHAPQTARAQGRSVRPLLGRTVGRRVKWLLETCALLASFSISSNVANIPEKIAHTAYSLNNRGHILHISWSLQSELASMCQSSFIVVINRLKMGNGEC